MFVHEHYTVLTGRVRVKRRGCALTRRDIRHARLLFYKWEIENDPFGIPAEENYFAIVGGWKKWREFIGGSLSP